VCVEQIIQQEPKQERESAQNLTPLSVRAHHIIHVK